MPDLKEKQRKSMNKDVFAYVDRNGEGHLPLNDETHSALSGDGCRLVR